MLDRQLTDRRVAEAIMRSARLEVEFEPVATAEEVSLRLKFTIFSTDQSDGRSFIFGEGDREGIWSVVRDRLEEHNL